MNKPIILLIISFESDSLLIKVFIVFDISIIYLVKDTKLNLSNTINLILYLF
jgi:hypothetical protein